MGSNETLLDGKQWNEKVGWEAILFGWFAMEWFMGGPLPL